MIRIAVPEDYEDILRILKENHEESLSVDGYMRNVFDLGSCWIHDTDDSLQGIVHVRERVLSLHDKNLRVSCLFPIQYDEALLQAVLDETGKTDLITLIQSAETQKYEALGFEPVIEHYEYNIDASEIPDFKIEGIILEPDTELCLEVYRDFTRHFTGFYHRSLEDFETMRRLVKRQGGAIIGLVQEQRFVGYAVYYKRGSIVEVVECFYDRSGTLLQLLSFVSKGVNRIRFVASISEKISRILPDVKRHKETFLLARINDQALFERLFHIKIISAYSGFHAFGKPTLNRDYI